MTKANAVIAALAARVKALEAALRECVTDDGAYCLQHQEVPGAMARRLRAITEIASNALKGQA